MEIIPEPEVAQRTWVYHYGRPEQGWPDLERHGWPEGNRAAKAITVHRLTVTIHQVRSYGGRAELDSIYVNGVWPNGNPVNRVRVHHDPGPDQHLIVTAPEWVLDVVADAIERSRQEIGVLGQTPMTAIEGAICDRITRGEAVPHYSTCARCNHGHVYHRHKTKLRPCELCGCQDLIRRQRDADADGLLRAAREHVGMRPRDPGRPGPVPVRAAAGVSAPA